jgi:RES domain-containing protein
MRFWRISNHADLTDEGGLLAAGRWHSLGSRIVYLADHPASALLEVLVHLEVDPEDIPASYQLIAVDLPDDTAFETVDPIPFPPDWRGQPGLTRQHGDAWVKEKRSLLLRVPSAIVPSATNWLFNPAHPDARNARIGDITRVPFDQRFFA